MSSAVANLTSPHYIVMGATCLLMHSQIYTPTPTCTLILACMYTIVLLTCDVTNFSVVKVLNYNFSYCYCYCKAFVIIIVLVINC